MTRVLRNASRRYTSIERTVANDPDRFSREIQIIERKQMQNER